MNYEGDELDVGKHIQAALAVVHPIVSTFTFPLFAVDARDRPDLYASSVLIECDGQAVLVTAAHAIFEIARAKSEVHLGAKNIVELPPNFILTSSNGQDELDLAAMVLPEQILMSEDIQPLRSARINVNRTAQTPHMRCVHGFPCSKNRFNSRGNTKTRVFTKYGFAYAGATHDLSVDYSAYGKREDTHRVLRYQRQSRNDNGETVTPPHPKGMSGGGMWSVPNSFEPGNVFLEGISIEYHEDSVVFATRIEHVIDFVRRCVLSPR